VGPIKIKLAVGPELRHGRVRLLVGREKPAVSFGRRQAVVILSSLLDHQVVIID
jgi:hypothetical protein